MIIIYNESSKKKERTNKKHYYNQKPHIEEFQTIQWPKEKEQKYKQVKDHTSNELTTLRFSHCGFSIYV